MSALNSLGKIKILRFLSESSIFNRMKLPDSIFIVPEKLPRHLLKKYKFELFHRVALACDFPEKHLCHGNVATIRDRHPAPDDGEPAYSFEVFNAIGD